MMLWSTVLAITMTQAEVGTEPAPGTAGTSDSALRDADENLRAGDVGAARSLYEEVAARHPDSLDAQLARRSIEVLTLCPHCGLRETATEVLVVEPYSKLTGERVNLTTWEKLDFGSTAFLYGLSIGFSYTIAAEDDDVTPLVLGSALYLIAAVAYLNSAQPDRGDLPLVLGITSYVPTTVGLALAMTDADAEEAGTAIALAGALSLPAAILIARDTSFDPGDAQLVRDAGFWGMVLSFTGVGASQSDSKDMAAAALVGLYGGLALGLGVAMNSEISLERVRVTTWGGYGGGILGALVTASSDDEEGLLQGISVGALAGLIITFAATSGLDRIPDNADILSLDDIDILAPAVMVATGADGRDRLLPGIDLARGRF
ncbi:MAG: hypothetical protein HYZ27_02610 [Deltaproteobacteria bacterium]|nr:hypothetical protein [Deltaproteobacteria bacterium]